MSLHYQVVVGLVVVATAAWGVRRFWTPGGSLAPSVAQGAYRNGIDGRVGFAAVGIVLAGLAVRVVLLGIDGILWVVFGGLYLAGVVVGAVVVSNRPRYRALQVAADTPAGAVTEGPVAVSGTVKPADGTLTTPFTGTDAVCYAYAIAEYASTHPTRDAGSWTTTDFGTERTRFRVADDSGSVPVDPEGAWLSVAPANAPTTTDTDAGGALSGGTAEYEVVVESGEQIPERARTFCAEAGTSYGPPSDSVVERGARFKEQVLQPGDPVVVVGEARPRRTEDGSAATVVGGGDSRSFFVARGRMDEVRAGLEQTVGRNAKIAAALTLVGAAGLYAPLVL